MDSLLGTKCRPCLLQKEAPLPGVLTRVCFFSLCHALSHVSGPIFLSSLALLCLQTHACLLHQASGSGTCWTLMSLVRSCLVHWNRESLSQLSCKGVWLRITSHRVLGARLCDLSSCDPSLLSASLPWPLAPALGLRNILLTKLRSARSLLRRCKIYILTHFACLSPKPDAPSVSGPECVSRGSQSRMRQRLCTGRSMACRCAASGTSSRQSPQLLCCVSTCQLCSCGSHQSLPWQHGASCVHYAPLPCSHGASLCARAQLLPARMPVSHVSSDVKKCACQTLSRLSLWTAATQKPTSHRLCDPLRQLWFLLMFGGFWDRGSSWARLALPWCSPPISLPAQMRRSTLSWLLMGLLPAPKTHSSRLYHCPPHRKTLHKRRAVHQVLLGASVHRTTLPWLQTCVAQALSGGPSACPRGMHPLRGVRVGEASHPGPSSSSSSWAPPLPGTPAARTPGTPVAASMQAPDSFRDLFDQFASPPSQSPPALAEPRREVRGELAQRTFLLPMVQTGKDATLSCKWMARQSSWRWEVCCAGKRLVHQSTHSPHTALRGWLAQHADSIFQAGITRPG